MISCIMIGIGQQRSSPAHTAGHTTRHSLGAEKNERRSYGIYGLCNMGDVLSVYHIRLFL